MDKKEAPDLNEAYQKLLQLESVFKITSIVDMESEDISNIVWLAETLVSECVVIVRSNV